jgi:drug/metabolite transporter (DMT)-like permease
MGAQPETGAHGGAPYHREMPADRADRAGRTGRTPSPARVWLILGTLYIVWGTTYLGIAKVNATIPPLLGAAARFLVAGSLLYAFGRLRSDERPGPPQWRAAGIVGVFLLFGGNAAVAWSERTVPTGIVSLIVALIPLWLALFDRVLLRSAPLGRRTVLGLVAGFGGAALLVGGSAIAGHVDLVGMLVAVGATLCWAIGSLYARRAPLPAHALLGSGMQQLVGGGVILAVATVSGGFGDLHLDAVSRSSWLGLCYLIVVGSFVGFSCYLWLLRNVRTSLVSTYAYVNPVVAVFLGWFVLNETLSPREFLAGAIILGAVAMIVSAGGTTRTDVDAEGAVVVAPASGQDGRPHLQPEVGLEGVRGTEQRGLGEHGSGELQPDR